MHSFCVFLKYIEKGILPRDRDTHEELIDACNYFGVDTDLFSIKKENLFVLDDIDQKIRDDEISLRKKISEGFVPDDRNIILETPETNRNTRTEIYNPIRLAKRFRPQTHEFVEKTKIPKFINSHKFRLLKNKNKEEYSLAKRFAEINLHPWLPIRNLIVTMKTEYPDMPFVLVGGAVLRIYEQKNFDKNQDLDFAFVGNQDDFLPSVKRFTEIFLSNYESQHMFVRTDNSITLLTELGRNGRNTNKSPLKIQFILRVYNSITQMLSGFDIDACCIAYDGNHFYGTPRFLRCQETNSIVADPDRQSKSYGFRLYKYMSRDYMIKFPGFIPSKTKLRYDGVGLSKILSTIMARNPREESDYENSLITNILDCHIFFDKTINYCQDHGLETMKINAIFAEDFDSLFVKSKRALRCEIGEELEGNTFIIITHNVKDFELITINPDTQLTDSFHPTTEDWYTDLYI
jgi:hypothetical protein